MPSLTVITFLYEAPARWVAKGLGGYSFEHANALERACRERLGVPHNFLTLTSNNIGLKGKSLPVWPPILVDGEAGCYRRLRAFSADFQESLGTDYVAMLDLDVVLMHDCRRAMEWAMQRDFCILRGTQRAGGGQLARYNGGMWVCRTGYRDEFWSTFRVVEMEALKKRDTAALRHGGVGRQVGTDQSWLSHRFPGEDIIGQDQGVYQYRDVHPSPPPPTADMVFFAGRMKPWSPDAPVICQREWRRFA